MNFDQYTVNINGTIVDPSAASISIFDRGFLFGDSIYEVSYSHKRCILFFDEHFDRLTKSAKLLNMNLQFKKDDIINEVLKTLKASDLEDAYFRIILTRGIDEIGLAPSQSEQNLVIIVKPRPIYPKEFYDNGIKLYLGDVTRNDKSSTDPEAKSGNYLNNVMAISEAKKRACHDSIMVNNKDYLTEGTSFNIWLIKDQKILTPKSQHGLLKGVTRGKILSLKDKYPVSTADITISDLKEADEVFISSSTRGIMKVSSVLIKEELIEYHSDQITRKLRYTYEELVSQHINQGLYSY